MQVLLDRQTPVGEMLRIAVLVRDQLLTRGFQQRGFLNQVIDGLQAWLVLFAPQNNPIACIVPAGTGESFDPVFTQMKAGAVALVIDLTSALKGLRSELGS